MNNKLLTNYKAVFFDLYGTLLVFNDADKSNTDWEKSYYNFIKRYKIVSFNDVKKICKDILESDVKKNKMLGLTTYETKIKYWLENLGITISKEELKNFADETVNVWQENIHLASEAKQVLSKLKTTKTLALITNFDHTPHLNRVVEKHGLNIFLNPIIISDVEEVKKPNPEIFEIALKETGFNNDEVTFVGDSKEDINGAIAAGINPILIRHNHDAKAEKKKKFGNVTTIYSLSELLD